MGKVFLFIYFMMIVVLVSGCGSAGIGNLDFSFDTDGNYAGFSTIPDNYSSEQAVKDGWYVSKDLEEIGGGNAWESFITDSRNGKDSSIRIMSIYDDAVYYQDLFYIGGFYRLFDSGSEDLSDHKFRYLLDLIGRMSNAKGDSRFIVLTDDETLTFENVVRVFSSSNMDEIKSISPFKLVAVLGL